MTATTLSFEARILPSAGLSWAALPRSPTRLDEPVSLAAEGSRLRGSTRATALHFPQRFGGALTCDLGQQNDKREADQPE
jgi:hypothetical protein